MSSSSSTHPPQLNYDASDEETIPTSPPTSPATTVSTIADSLQSVPLPHPPPLPILIPDPNLPPPPISPPPLPQPHDALFPGLPLRYHILDFHNVLHMRERVEEEAEDARQRFGMEVLIFFLFKTLLAYVYLM
jgi:hypothetical protein